MKHAYPRRTLFTAAALTAASLALAAAALADAPGRWTYALSAGAGVPYQYRLDEHSYGSYSSSLGPGLIASLSGARTLTRHTSLVIAGGYRTYDTELSLVAIPETPPTTGTLSAEYFSLGAGLRIQPWSEAGASGPYLQVMPGLFVSRWEESTVDHEGFDMLTGAWRSQSTHTDSFRSTLPGIELSAGFRARITSAVGTDFAVRLTRSADLGAHALGRFSSGDFQGINEVALVGGITWSP